MDDREPARFVFDAGDLTKLIEFWTSAIGWLFLKRRKPYPARMITHMWPRESKRFNEIMAGFDERYFKREDKVAKLLSCAKRLYDWGAMTQGYICHEEDWNAKNYFGVPTKVTSGKSVSTGGLWLEEHLPGIYWANFFGPIYVQFFGREKFRSVPAYQKEELPNGGFLLLTSPSPLDYGRPEARALEQRIIDHLGREAFFEKTQPHKPPWAPEFTFEQAPSEHRIEGVAYDPVSQVIHDPNHFIQRAAELAEELDRQFSGELDYSPESLRVVDDFILKNTSRRQEPSNEPERYQIIRELTAYYGEVLRRNLGGRWVVLAGSTGIPHPAILLLVNDEKQVEHPFTRVIKLLSEREGADGLAVRYHLLQTGQVTHIEDYLKGLE